MIAVIHLFAGARELVGMASVTIAVRDGATVADLRRALMQQHPDLTPLLDRSRIAVDQEFAADTAVVPDGAEIALIPPVSGGLIP